MGKILKGNKRGRNRENTDVGGFLVAVKGDVKPVLSVAIAKVAISRPQEGQSC